MRKKLKNWQKTLIAYISFFLAIVIVAVCFISLASSPDKKYGILSGVIEHSKNGQNITDMVLNSGSAVMLLENEKLSLSVSPDGNISVTNRFTGKVWSTDVSDEIVNKFGQGYNETHSFLSLTYTNELNAEAEWNSYDQCIKKKQLQIYKTDDGKIRFDFIFGESTTDQFIPPALTKERLEKDILPKLDENDVEFIKRQYKLYDSKKLTAEDNPDKLYKEYPKLKDEPLYIAANLESKMIKQKLTKVFEKIGYSVEDYESDNRLTGYSSSSLTYTYKVAVDLSISGNELVVEIPKDEIEFYREHPIVKLSLMRFFAKSTEKTAVLIPSGSGAIAEFEQGGKISTYKGNVYGKDLTTTSQTMPEVMDSDSKLSFPIFSIRQGIDTLTAIVDSGAANAVFNYNSNAESMYCYYDFTILQSDRAYLDQKNNITQYGNDILSEDVTVKYIFGNTEADYSNERVFSAVACDYRERLLYEGKLNQTSSDVSSDPTVLLELLGNVTVKKDFLSLFPVNSDLVLTDFNQAAEMVKWFSQNTNSNIAVNLKGWNKGGLYRQTLGKISFASKLGGEKSYRAFVKTLNKLNVAHYYSTEHTVYLNDSLFDSYKKSYNAKFVDGSSAIAKGYTPVEGGYSGYGEINIVSPSKYAKIADEYIKDGAKAICVSTFANSLNSDYNVPYFDRSRTQKEVEKALVNYKKANLEIATDDANLYAIKYCKLIGDIPTNAVANAVFEKSFPFKQILLHGSVDYTAKVDFGVAESENSLLMAIAMGSGLKSVLSYDNSDYNLPSSYSDIYTTSYENNRETVAEYSNKLFGALQGLGKEKIVSYETVGTVSKTEYSNGTVIYVNTGDVDSNFDTVMVGAKSYLRINK